MRSLIHSTIQDVSIKEKLGHKVIQAALDRLVAGNVNWANFKSLDTLGIDEIALRKGHDEYVTIISARLNDGSIRVLAVIEGRGKADIKSFFESIPPRLQKTVKSVCTDMHDAFVYAAIEVFGPQAVVIDRYHVAKLYRKPLDKLRIKEMKRLKSELDSDEYAKLEGMMWILRKQHECLSDADKSKLELLYKHSDKLKKAHSYALKLTSIFNTHCGRKSGMAKLNRWIKVVQKSMPIRKVPVTKYLRPAACPRDLGISLRSWIPDKPQEVGLWFTRRYRHFSDKHVKLTQKRYH